MIKIRENIYCPLFEYLYLFVIVIYMAQMTPETARMVGTLSGNPVPFLIPIFLTIILFFRHPISFACQRLWLLVGVLLCWSFAVCYKFHDFSTQNLSYYFFLFYAIIIAYIIIRVYGRDLFYIYEHIIVVLSVISLVIWGLSSLSIISNSFFHLFPETIAGNNVLYIYHWIDPLKLPENSNPIRNAGCSWEPGRFAIMLIPAILINLSRRGVTFYKNKEAVILTLALVSTFSTTGYSITILLYAIYWFEKLSAKRILFFIVIFLPLFWFIFSLDFMSEKIQDRMNSSGITEERLDQMEYHNENDRDEYLGSLDRFESAAFDLMNFKQDPLLGYGRNRDHSWFRQEISENFELTGGLVKIFSQYGIFIGLLLYILLFLSSFKITRLFPHQRKIAFALAVLLCSVSYIIFTIPIFTAFWLYGLFCYKNDENASRILLERKRCSYPNDRHIQWL